MRSVSARLAASVLAASLLFACEGGEGPVEPEEASPPSFDPLLAIVDGDDPDGNPGVHFRLPIGLNLHGVPGDFDPSVPLRMEIAKLGGGGAQSYSVAAGEIRVLERLQSYMLLWSPPEDAVDGTVFRVTLFAGPLELHAYADLEMVKNGRDAWWLIRSNIDNAPVVQRWTYYPITVYVNTQAIAFAEGLQSEEMEEQPGVVDAEVVLVDNSEGGTGQVFNRGDPAAPLVAQVTTFPGQAVDADGNVVEEFVLTMLARENDFDPLPGVSDDQQFPYFFTAEATTVGGAPVSFTTVGENTGAQVDLCQPESVHQQLTDEQVAAQVIFNLHDGTVTFHETAVGSPLCGASDPLPIRIGPGMSAADVVSLGRRGLRSVASLFLPASLRATHGGLRTLSRSGMPVFSHLGSVLATDPAASTAQVPDGTAGSPTSISIQANVSATVPQAAGGDDVRVEVSGANAASLAVGSGITDHGDGTYTATYTPASAGEDLVAITIRNPETGAQEAISGSPFSSTVASPGARIDGNVRYSTSALPAVQVDLVEADEGGGLGATLQTTTTEASGRYLFSGVAPGNYHVRTWGPTEAFITWVASSLEVGSEDVTGFDIDLPKNILLLSPANGAQGVSPNPLLQWTANPEAVRYVVQVNVTNGFELVAHEESTTNSHTPSVTLSAGETYTWQVDAYDAESHRVGTTQQAFTFTVASVPPGYQIASIALASDTLVIEGPLVSYDAVLTNGSAAPLVDATLQAYLDQGEGTSRAAGGLVVALPPGSSQQSFGASASNNNSGQGTLVAGPAVLRFELTQDGAVLDTYLLNVMLLVP